MSSDGEGSGEPAGAKKNNLCCHWCRISAKRKRSSGIGYVSCPACRMSFCHFCLKNHMKLDPEAIVKKENDYEDWKCWRCEQRCCCQFTECAKSHRHCYTYRRTKKRHSEVVILRWSKGKKPLLTDEGEEEIKVKMEEGYDGEEEKEEEQQVVEEGLEEKRRRKRESKAFNKKQKGTAEAVKVKIEQRTDEERPKVPEEPEKPEMEKVVKKAPEKVERAPKRRKRKEREENEEKEAEADSEVREPRKKRRRRERKETDTSEQKTPVPEQKSAVTQEKKSEKSARERRERRERRHQQEEKESNKRDVERRRNSRRQSFDAAEVGNGEEEQGEVYVPPRKRTRKETAKYTESKEQQQKPRKKQTENQKVHTPNNGSKNGSSGNGHSRSKSQVQPLPRAHSPPPPLSSLSHNYFSNDDPYGLNTPYLDLPPAPHINMTLDDLSGSDPMKEFSELPTTGSSCPYDFHAPPMDFSGFSPSFFPDLLTSPDKKSSSSSFIKFV